MTEAPIYRFGAFELDTRTGELRRDGLLVRLQPQPCKVLTLLVRRASEMVSREEIYAAVWGDTVVEESNLNFCIKQIRAALGDDADSPLFVETLPKRGYRFIAPVAKPARVSTVATKTTLVVLPFKNLSGELEQDYFSQGITEEMIAQLGRLRPQQLGVIARTTAMHYKDTDKRVDQIAMELGADYVLEGSVRRSGQRVRITAQLIQASDQTHLWAETYEQELTDILAIQKQVAEQTAGSLTLELLPAQRAAMARAVTKNSTAYEAYLRGRYFWNRRTEDGFQKAMHYFQEAIKNDPAYSPAFAGLADCYNTLGLYGAFPPSQARQGARTNAELALALDDASAEAHTSLAYANVLWEWDWPAAEAEYRKALDLNPNYVTAHHWYALFLAPMGRFAEAFAQMDHSLELDPLSLALNSHLGWLLYFARRYDAALEQLHKTVEMDPSFPLTHYFLGLVYARKSLLEEAVEELQQAIELSGTHPGAVAALGHVHGLAGRKAEAKKLAGRLEQLSGQRCVSPYYMAFVYAGLGDSEEAFVWLRKAYEERSGWLVHLKVEPGFDSLRSHSRFQELLRLIRFPN